MSKKKLAVFCDGTWNDLRMADRTNVSRLAKCVAPADALGTPQVIYYDEGVGVAASVSKAVDELVKVLGGAFGRGLNQKIEAAYRFIVSNYQPGDDIYIFGFSRGAYTARSLCGLIRKCGILKRDCFDKIPEAMALYRNALHPKSPEMVEFRSRYAHPVAAGSEDHSRLSISKLDLDRARQDDKATVAQLYQYRPAQSYSLMYLGVWDTVGSLGVPARFKLLSFLNREYRFHDTEASSLIASIRHAVSIDEDRRVFASTEVDNIDDLNREWAERTGWRVEEHEIDAARFAPYRWRPYQQLWFPGDHGAVGGGNPEPGLSSHTLLWIAEGAQRAGLHMLVSPTNELGRARDLRNACADWRVNKDGSRRNPAQRDFLGRVGGFNPRTGPRSRKEVGGPTWERWLRDPTYRSRNLSVLQGAMTLPASPKPPAGFPPEPPFQGAP